MASDKIVQVTDADFEQKVLKSTLPTVVDFWAEWCGPCRMVAPTLEELAEEVAGKALIAKLNVDENRQTPTQYKIHAIPTMIFFKDGKEIARVVGVETKKTIRAKIDEML
ncbi:MAG: thioredoxin [Candidatus Abyssobacteria bacterium SURF_17]|uniref:Thioredoxin n=1 Tax=Candidatus Abyssobacteria bacterium SURF_17 TaxID=2093361 RepID=A0A419F2M4_9BACT|nr:MAG: thioredoxin [Candidatus Abyssubacteria bacterium SURF_17]